MEHMHGYSYINAVYWGLAKYIKDAYKASIKPLSKVALHKLKWIKHTYGNTHTG
jgi:hypothetical protein